MPQSHRPALLLGNRAYGIFRCRTTSQDPRNDHFASVFGGGGVLKFLEFCGNALMDVCVCERGTTRRSGLTITDRRKEENAAAQPTGDIVLPAVLPALHFKCSSCLKGLVILAHLLEALRRLASSCLFGALVTGSKKAVSLTGQLDFNNFRYTGHLSEIFSSAAGYLSRFSVRPARESSHALC